jgi:hypothetical protein
VALTAAQARDSTRAAIVILAEIQTLNGGPLLYFSDRNIIVGGVAYCDYLAAVSGVGDTLFRATSDFSSQAASVTLRNNPYDDGTTAYSHLSELSEDFPLEGAAVAIKRVYLDDAGAPTTPETLLVGNFDSPQNITRIALTCSVMCREAFISQQTR